MKKITILLSLLFLAACVRYSGDKFSKVDSITSSNAIVYIYSAETNCIDFGQMNAGIMINNKETFTLAENSYAKLILHPGVYTFNASTDNQKACHGKWSPGDYWPSVKLTLEAGSLRFLQYNPSSDLCISSCLRHLKEVSQELATKEMKGAKGLLIDPI